MKIKCHRCSCLLQCLITRGILCILCSLIYLIISIINLICLTYLNTYLMNYMKLFKTTIVIQTKTKKSKANCLLFRFLQSISRHTWFKIFSKFNETVHFYSVNPKSYSSQNYFLNNAIQLSIILYSHSAV